MSAPTGGLLMYYYVKSWDDVGQLKSRHGFDGTIVAVIMSARFCQEKTGGANLVGNLFSDIVHL
jgi:hypothetical protein